MGHSFLPAILLLLSLAAAHAQSTVETRLPWNGYDSVQIVQNRFVSIAGTGTRIEGSQNVGPEGKVFPLNFNDFSIGFIQQAYNPPVNLKVCTNGWVSFNGSASTEGAPIPQLWYSRYTTRAFDNKVLMAYWCNLRTDDVPGGGIYWQSTTAPVTVDGVTTNRRCLIIEWKARANFSPAAPGGFQVRIFERVGYALNSMIEWHFGESSSINLPMSTETDFHYGAQVGVKNFGQVEGDPMETGDPAGLDREKFLIIANPNQLPSLTKRGITRLRTMAVPTYSGDTMSFRPEWWAYYSRYYTGAPVEWSSLYYHYGFPTGSGVPRLAYRMKPVIVDMGASSITLNGLNAAVPNSFEAGTEFRPEIGFVNLGAETIYNVPFDVRIYRILKSGPELTPVHEYEGRVDSVPPEGVELRVPGYGKRGYFLQQPGFYRIIARAKLPGDQNPYNDSIVGSFIVRGEQADLLAREVVQPRPNADPDPVVYRVGEAVPFVARFMNTGYTLFQGVGCGYRVVDGRGKLVDSGSATVNVIAAGDSATVVFSSQWIPSRPGTYYFRTFITGEPDPAPANDTLPAGRGDGNPANGNPSYGIPFEVYYEVDAAVANPQGAEPYAPRPEDLVSRFEETRLMTTIFNNGAGLLKSVPVQVSINGPGGGEVFTKTVNATDIPANGSTILHIPGFTPAGIGQHTVKVSVSVAGDAVPANDIAQWGFFVLFIDGVEDGIGTAGHALAIRPNPANERAVLAYRAPEGAELHITLLDIYGTLVKHIHEEAGAGEGTIVLETAGLPAGVYIVRLQTRHGIATTKMTVVR